MDQSSSSSLNSTCLKRKRDLDSFDDEPSSCKRPKNDVFINYSFEDIGKTFISHLRGALVRSSFTISDHTMLPVGQDMLLELLKAIKESEMYVVVFSSNYASSRRTLNELVEIMDHFRKLDERKVLPVFFKVDPSHVRNQQGPFMEAFQAHETNVDAERVQEWRHALRDAGQLSGLTLPNGDEAKFVNEIVEELEKLQRPQELHVADHPIGIGSRAEELISTLRLDWNDRVLVVAVFGFSGIGKTTIVKEAYNRIAQSFDISCFFGDIHYMCQVPNWKVELPKALISYLTHENTFSFMRNHNEGVTKIRRLVRGRKVLLVLDDIDNFQQLESLGICPEWFHKGSRIIVTTRDKSSLGNIPYAPYHTKLLNRRESLNLFTRLMFVRDDPAVNTKFIEEVVNRAGGLPLILKVWSRHFQQHETEQWPSILETLKGIPHGDVQKQLQLSYDSLSPRLKKLFLDIACFFDGMEKDLVVKILEDDDSRFFPTIEIQYLVDKSLVEMNEYCELRMHRAIREMGREIVRQENEDEPGQRTRLWNKRDVKRVLTECSGTESIESIRVTSLENVHGVTLDAFRKMSNLRLIHLYGVDYSLCNFSHHEIAPLSFRRLKYMFMEEFPFRSLDIIQMSDIVVLEIKESNLETLWEGMKCLKKLRVLNVSYSDLLTKTGNFIGLENLKELYFHDCINLKELHRTISDLQKLAILDLRSSIPLNMIPWEMIGKLASLHELHLGKLVTTSEPYEVDEPLLYSLKACPVTRLELYGCTLTNISSGVASLAWLKHLHLYRVTFDNHPDSLLQLHKLNSIEFDDCDTMRSIPNLPVNTTSIKAQECKSLVNLPCNISELKSLTMLYFSLCHKLGAEDPSFYLKITGLINLSQLCIHKCSVSHVPSEIGNLVSLKDLNLSYNSFSSLPDSLCNLSQLLYLDIDYCRQLKFLPLLPSNLTNILASGFPTLDVMSSASVLTKACKELPISNRFMVQLQWKKEVPDWCSHQNTGDALSFVASVRPENKICGIILCANTSDVYDSSIIIPTIYNKTKSTSHRFKANTSHRPATNMWKSFMCVMSYPLDDTTLMVEHGDSVSVLVKLSHGSVSSCGLRVIYEGDVVDGKLVVQTVDEHTPHIPLEMPTGVTQ